MSGSPSSLGFADIRQELEAWLEAVITWFPGKVGVKLRVLYYRRRLGSCGRAPIFAMGVRIASPQKLFLGNRVGIGAGAFITAEGGVTIGDYVGIGPDTKIWSVNHIFTNPDIPWRDQGWEKQAVVIEEDAWIGAASFIMPGVHIGKGAIISAGTVLAKSVPAFSIVAGNPGRVIGWRKKPEIVTEGT
jgi:maltose O-acetyltransferase